MAEFNAEIGVSGLKRLWEATAFGWTRVTKFNHHVMISQGFSRFTEAQRLLSVSLPATVASSWQIVIAATGGEKEETVVGEVVWGLLTGPDLPCSLFSSQ
jgi:hypothetical protein